MKMHNVFFLVFGLFLFLAQGLFAQDFYVSTTGSDSTGDGSLGNPWATITNALDNAPDDGSVILVQPGTYNGRIRLRGTFTNGITVKSQTPYQAKLRHTSTVITCYTAKGITLEGFDIAHTGSGAGALVIQIQDLIGDPGGADFTSNITIKDNIIHDSFNNDLLKINNGAGDIIVEGNMFYNQTGSDEHIDINSVTNVVVQDNVFFNDFEGSGRVNGNNTSSYIVIKDSNDNSDGILGSQNITVRRNVFLNWQGSTGSNFVLVGEDGMDYFEAQNVLVENNLMLGNSRNVMRASVGVKGSEGITFRNNSVVGNLPAFAYDMRLNTEGLNDPNENVHFFNNLWSDPTGTMGAGNSGSNDFSDTPVGETLSFILENNLYYNGTNPIPSDTNELVNYTDDPVSVIGDPVLPSQAGIVLPRWNETTGSFNDGSSTIRQAFENLVNLYGVPGTGSVAIDGADLANAPVEDILKNFRTDGFPDIGAVEVVSTGPTPTPSPTPIPSPTPTPDPTPTPTPTPEPTPTPTPEPTPTPQPTPTPTPTPQPTPTTTPTPEPTPTPTPTPEPTPTPPPFFIDKTASSQSLISGTVLSGSLSDTFSSDGLDEVLRENTNGGKKSDRTSFVEKEFVFDSSGGTEVSFHVNAFYSNNQSDQIGDDEKFIFQYFDENASTWVNMVDVSTADNIDDDIYHIFTGLPTDAGPITVRVISEFQNLQGNNGRDELSIDHMFIRCGSDGSPTPTPTPQPTTTPTPTPTPPSGDITLITDGFKDKGAQKVNLDWSPSGTSVEVTVIRTHISGKGTSATFNTANDGTHLDDMTTKGGSVYDYQVCEAGTSTCSNVSRVTF